MYGYGLLSSQQIRQFLVFASLNETCLWLNSLYDLRLEIWKTQYFNRLRDMVWYPQACRFLNVEHHFHSSYQKSIIERTIQYMKDRTECFDDYFPCRKDNNDCNLKHVMNWLGLFVDSTIEKLCKKLLCCMIHYVVSDTYLTTSHLACYSNYSGMIDWACYNESLVRRGQVLLDFDVLDGWDHELSQINESW